MLFDIDGTLCEYRQSSEAVLEAAFAEERKTVCEFRRECFANLAANGTPIVQPGGRSPRPTSGCATIGTAAFDLALDALDALDARPERAIYVDNSPATDVAGAAAAGLRSVWVPDAPDTSDGRLDGPVPDYAFDSLYPLCEPSW